MAKKDDSRLWPPDLSDDWVEVGANLWVRITVTNGRERWTTTPEWSRRYFIEKVELRAGRHGEDAWARFTDRTNTQTQLARLIETLRVAEKGRLCAGVSRDGLCLAIPTCLVIESQR